MNRTKSELKRPASDLVAAVKQKPGIHFRELARAADISSMGQLRHHVDRLCQGGWLVEVEDGRYKRFFITGSHPPALRKTLARFSRPVPLRIGQLLLGRPMSRGELRRSLGCADSTLGYHLARMCLDGDIIKTGLAGRCNYALADPDTVREALLLRNTEASHATTEATQPTQEKPTMLAHPDGAWSAPVEVRNHRPEEKQNGSEPTEPLTSPSGRTRAAEPAGPLPWPKRPAPKAARVGRAPRRAPAGHPSDGDEPSWPTRTINGGYPDTRSTPHHATTGSRRNGTRDQTHGGPLHSTSRLE